MSRSDWLLVSLGSLTMLAGIAVRPAHVFPAYRAMFLLSAVLTLGGAVMAVVPLVTRVKLCRPPIDEENLIGHCRSVCQHLIVAVLGWALGVFLILLAFPGLVRVEGYVLHVASPWAMGVSLAVYLPCVVIWFCLMRRRPFPSQAVRKALGVAVPAVVTIPFLVLAVGGAMVVATHSYPVWSLACVWLVLGMQAVLTALIASCCYWFALWGLAAGA